MRSEGNFTVDFENLMMNKLRFTCIYSMVLKNMLDYIFLKISYSTISNFLLKYF